MPGDVKPLTDGELTYLRSIEDEFDLAIPDEKTIAQLLATVRSLERERDRWQKRWTSLGEDFDKEVPALREENKQLREALEPIMAWREKLLAWSGGCGLPSEPKSWEWDRLRAASVPKETE